MSQLESVQFVVATSTELEITIREFLLVLRGKGRVKDTIDKYHRHLSLWREWLAQRGVVELNEVTTLLLREWCAEIQERPDWSTATARFAVSVVRSFFSWCNDEERINRRLLDALSAPSPKIKVQRTLTEDEIQLMLDSCNDTFFGIRNAALIAMLYDTGFRASEICRLEISRLHFNELMQGERVNYGVVIIKGGDERPGFFEAETRAYLERWLAVRPAKPGVNTVFVSLGGNTPWNPLTRFGLREIIAEIGQRCGIVGASPHAFRRAFACALDEAGASSTTIAKLGRWSDIKLVQRYTQARQAGRQFRQFSPMKRLEQSKKQTQ